MCLSQNEIILLGAIIIAIIYIIYHTNNCNANETFDGTPQILAEKCNLNNEGFICGVTCKAFGTGYYVNKGQGCSNTCICP